MSAESSNHYIIVNDTVCHVRLVLHANNLNAAAVRTLQLAIACMQSAQLVQLHASAAALCAAQLGTMASVLTMHAT